MSVTMLVHLIFPSRVAEKLCRCPVRSELTNGFIPRVMIMMITEVATITNTADKTTVN
jgi:hypothetical protein